MKQYETVVPPFGTRFESGNLAVAQCEGPDLYTLLASRTSGWLCGDFAKSRGRHWKIQFAFACLHPDLLIEVDVDANTDGYTQWFYFAVQGGSCGLKVTFRLVNMAKSGSLFGSLVENGRKMFLALSYALRTDKYR